MDTVTRKKIPQKRIAGSVGEKTSVPELSDLSHIVDIRTHPLFTGEELLPTAPVIELFKIVKRAVLLHETSICMSAASGAGKTSALEIVQALMTQSYPKLPVFVHNEHNQQIPSIRAFFKHFLVTVGHDSVSGETYDLRRRLINTLVDDARLSGERSILLLVDEAQAMSISDFNFLKDVYNDLLLDGIQLTTILMGQDPDLAQVLLRLRTEGRLDLIGRFAMRHLPFRAYRNDEDIRQIFSSIDKAEHPAASGISWTMAFFQYLWRSGFRFENETEAFMKALRKVSKTPIGDTVQIPARQTFLAIRAFIIDNAAFKEDDVIPKDAWELAIEYAKVEDAMLLSQAPGKKRRRSEKK